MSQWSLFDFVRLGKVVEKSRLHSRSFQELKCQTAFMKQTRRKILLLFLWPWTHMSPNNWFMWKIRKSANKSIGITEKIRENVYRKIINMKTSIFTFFFFYLLKNVINTAQVRLSKTLYHLAFFDSTHVSN